MINIKKILLVQETIQLGSNKLLILKKIISLRLGYLKELNCVKKKL